MNCGAQGLGRWQVKLERYGNIKQNALHYQQIQNDVTYIFKDMVENRYFC
jgi:hypothetical protein